MNPDHMHDKSSNARTSFWKSRIGVAIIMVGLVILFYLLREHWNHIVGGNWLYLLLLLCPLMHLFGHGGHRHSPTEKPSSGEGKN